MIHLLMLALAISLTIVLMLMYSSVKSLELTAEPYPVSGYINSHLPYACSKLPMDTTELLSYTTCGYEKNPTDSVEPVINTKYKLNTKADETPFDMSIDHDSMGSSGDNRIAKKMKHISSMNKRAIDIRSRFNKYSIQKYFNEELRDTANSRWWDNDNLEQYM